MSLFFAYLSVVSALASGLAALFANQRLFVEHLLRVVLRIWPVTQAGSEYVLAETRYVEFHRKGLFILLGIAGASAVLAGFTALSGGGVLTDNLPFGLPWLSWHVRLDALSGFFFMLLGLVLVAVSLFGPGYVREFEHHHHSIAVLGFFTGLFVAGMELVLLADDAFFFVISWELMSVASYFLVAFQHEHAANRRAALLYLLRLFMRFRRLPQEGIQQGFQQSFAPDFGIVHELEEAQVYRQLFL